MGQRPYAPHIEPELIRLFIIPDFRLRDVTNVITVNHGSRSTLSITFGNVSED